MTCKFSIYIYDNKPHPPSKLSVQAKDGLLVEQL
ncbi:hypothetical protein T02_15973 [Trichinella nativa]|uniref:Uncharacterized protein n=1 Tax=Trichinella nativa TaxID=6335 RepID=A0A0V1KJ71_9BILA|nr:hypothetical protein T02_15973 [Trichinella nativa]